MDIKVLASGIKLVGGVVVGQGIKNVVNQSLGWTVGKYTKPIDKVVTAIGVYAIGQMVTSSACRMMDEALDKAADLVIAAQDKLEEMKEQQEGESDDISEEEDE